MFVETVFTMKCTKAKYLATQHINVLVRKIVFFPFKRQNPKKFTRQFARKRLLKFSKNRILVLFILTAATVKICRDITFPIE